MAVHRQVDAGESILDGHAQKYIPVMLYNRGQDHHSFRVGDPVAQLLFCASSDIRLNQVKHLEYKGPDHRGIGSLT